MTELISFSYKILSSDNKDAFIEGVRRTFRAKVDRAGTRFEVEGEFDSEDKRDFRSKLEALKSETGTKISHGCEWIIKGRYSPRY